MDCCNAGMQLKFDLTDLHEFFTRYSVVDSFSAVWVTPYPHPQIFFFLGGVKFRFFDFVISSYLTSKLSTIVLYLLSVPPFDFKHAECCSLARITLIRDVWLIATEFFYSAHA